MNLQQEIERRIGADWHAWSEKGLVPFLAQTAAGIGVDSLFTEEECRGLAHEIVAEYAATPAMRGALLRDFLPRTRGEVARVRSYIARVARNAIVARSRGHFDQVWTEVCDAPGDVPRVQRQYYRRFTEEVVDEKAQAFGREHLFEGSTSSFSALDQVQDPLRGLLMREEERLLDPKTVLFAEEVQAHRDHVRQNVPRKAARTERLLLEGDRVNSAYVFLKALYVLCPEETQEILPLMVARWEKGRNSVARLAEFAFVAHPWISEGLDAHGSLSVSFREEARRMLRLLAKHGFVKVDERVRAQVEEDARLSVVNWRGAYNTRGKKAQLS
jgi:hypothetical protein